MTATRGREARRVIREARFVEAVARGAVSAAPSVGAAAAELLGLVHKPAVGHCREESFRHLGGAFEDLRRRLDGFDPAHLATNAVFSTAVITVSNAALGTHEAAKLEGLTNAVINNGLPISPDEHAHLSRRTRNAKRCLPTAMSRSRC